VRVTANQGLLAVRFKLEHLAVVVVVLVLCWQYLDLILQVMVVHGVATSITQVHL
jgi:hypothetical protein